MARYLGQQLGNYRLTRLLGQGGFAEVYLGEHVRLGMKAAVKILQTSLSGSAITAFQQEAQIIAALAHPHIIRVLDFDVQAGIPFLVLEYAPKGSLRHRHPRGIQVPLPQVVEYVTQLASALHFAHARRLIHRDIKPENMLVGNRGELLLSDFGIATMAHSTSSLNTQASMGTLAYMPPEQIQGKPRTESDQYALAVVVYQWLTGDLPFQGSSTEMIAQHLAVSPPLLRTKVPDLPAGVEQAVLKALAKDPKDRFAQVQEFAQVLQDASAVQPCSNQPEVSGLTATVAAAPAAVTSPAPGVTPTVAVTPSSALATEYVTPPPAIASQAAIRRAKRFHRSVIMARVFTLLFVFLSIGFVAGWANAQQPPSYAAITQNAPASTYTMRDQQSRAAWEQAPGCTFTGDGLVAAGSLPALCESNPLPRLGSSDILLAVTLTIQEGSCGIVADDDMGVEICADGTFSSDVELTRNQEGTPTGMSTNGFPPQTSQALHRGLHVANTIAFDFVQQEATSSSSSFTHTIYINGQAVDTIHGFSGGGTPPSPDSLTPDTLYLQASQNGSVLFQGVNIWLVNPDANAGISTLFASLFWGDLGALALIWPIWLISTRRIASER